MTTFDLILAYPFTALAVFLAAVAVLWLCLSAALWAAWVLGWFDLSAAVDWWSRVARPRLAQQWREVSELWDLPREDSRGLSRLPRAQSRGTNVRGGGSVVGEKRLAMQFSQRKADASPTTAKCSTEERGRSAVHTMTKPPCPRL